jgi:membrane-bound lytic murein transglycosylase B
MTGVYMVVSMTILKGRIPRRNALGVLGGALVAACQNGTAAQTRVSAGASATSQPVAPPAAPVVLSPANFSRWLESARAEALTRGIGSATVQTALSGIEPLPKVVELDRRQPEFVNTFSRYLGNAVSEREHLAVGREAMNERCADGCLHADDFYVGSVMFDSKCGAGKQAAAAKGDDE